MFSECSRSSDEKNSENLIASNSSESEEESKEFLICAEGYQ